MISQSGRSSGQKFDPPKSTWLGMKIHLLHTHIYISQSIKLDLTLLSSLSFCKNTKYSQEWLAVEISPCAIGYAWSVKWDEAERESTIDMSVDRMFPPNANRIRRDLPKRLTDCKKALSAKIPLKRRTVLAWHCSTLFSRIASVLAFIGFDRTLHAVTSRT